MRAKDKHRQYSTYTIKGSGFLATGAQDGQSHLPLQSGWWVPRLRPPVLRLGSTRGLFMCTNSAGQGDRLVCFAHRYMCTHQLTCTITLSAEAMPDPPMPSAVPSWTTCEVPRRSSAPLLRIREAGMSTVPHFSICGLPGLPAEPSSHTGLACCCAGAWESACQTLPR